MEIYKRNGQKVLFDKNKILKSVKAAYESVGEIFHYEDDRSELINFFTPQKLQTWCVEELGVSIPNVEDIQDRVEKWLMTKNPKVAKAYILYREQRKQARFIKKRINYMEEYSQSHDNAATSSETDANANVTMKNVANLEGEVYKVTNRLIQRARMKDKLNEMFPEVAKQYEKDLNHHIIYTHDEASTPVLKNYCEAVSLYPLLTEGVGGLDGVTPFAPHNLDSFCGQFVNAAFLLASQCKGAVAFGSFFVAFNYYCVKEWGSNYYNKTSCIVTSEHCNKKRTIQDTIIQAFQQCVWGINQPAGNRGYQSPLRYLVI